MNIFKKNEPTSALLHLLGLFLSVAGFIIMVEMAIDYGTKIHLISFIVFGSSLVLLYSSSAIFHILQKDTSIKKLFQKLDHSMIYVLIAGTYTPICLSMPDKNWGLSFLGIIYGLTVAGIILKTSGKLPNNWISMLIYIIMGWLIIIMILPVIHWLPVIALYWLIGGGLFYTIGCVFFILDRSVRRTHWMGMHEVFHLFVMAGSFCHFWLMIKYLLYV